MENQVADESVVVGKFGPEKYW